MFRFEKPLPAAFGLAFDIEKTSDTASGFMPADIDLGGGEKLFADLRLDGFAALMRLNFAEKIIIVGGMEGRYREEKIPRAWAICQMLEKDCGIAAERLEWRVSGSNTGGNVQIITNSSGRTFPTVITSHYHVGRTLRLFREVGHWADIISAEAFWVLEDLERKDAVAERLGGGSAARRDAIEVRGVAQLLEKTYVARTDIPKA